MKYLYVLVSGEDDYYLEQCLVSIFSLRNKTPRAFVSLLTDDLTRKTLSGTRGSIREVVDELKAVPLGGGGGISAKERSRTLKVSMRRYIEGDFLFIDCDTVIADNLHAITEDAKEMSIGAVMDHHGPLSALFDHTVFSQHAINIKRSLRETDQTAGFMCSKMDAHFNSGVLYCKDTPGVHDFFNEWERLWRIGFSKGIVQDQPACNQANHNAGGIIKALNPVWNCQIVFDGSIRFLAGSKIIHYFSSYLWNTEKPYLFASKRLFEEVKRTGSITGEIKELLQNPRAAFSERTDIMLLGNIPANQQDDIPPVQFDERRLPVIQTTISFVVVSRGDNTKRLAALLESLVPLKDELVLILDNNDAGVYKEFTGCADKVVQKPGIGCFEESPLEVFQYCTKDWIFRVDDDETLSPNCTREALNRYIANRLVNAYWIPRRWLVDEEQYICSGPWFPDYQLRLFRNIPAIITLPRRVHEGIVVMGNYEHLDELWIEHWDLLTPREKREKKVAHYRMLFPNNGCDAFYLYEDEIYTLIQRSPPPPRVVLADRITA